MTINFTLLIFYIIGVTLAGIFVHELIHIIQFWNVPDKEICFDGKFTKHFAYIDGVAVKTQKEKWIGEVVPTIVGVVIHVYGFLYIYDNWNKFKN